MKSFLIWMYFGILRYLIVNWYHLLDDFQKENLEKCYKKDILVVRQLTNGYTYLSALSKSRDEIALSAERFRDNILIPSLKDCYTVVDLHGVRPSYDWLKEVFGKLKYHNKRFDYYFCLNNLEIQSDNKTTIKVIWNYIEYT